MANTEYIHCPYCNCDDYEFWASENSFNAVKCSNCDFIYVNPRPKKAIIKKAVETGYHNELKERKSAISRRVPRKIHHYKKLFKSMFEDIWDTAEPISWLDIGAVYGEVIESIKKTCSRRQYYRRS